VVVMLAPAVSLLDMRVLLHKLGVRVALKFLLGRLSLDIGLFAGWLEFGWVLDGLRLLGRLFRLIHFLGCILLVLFLIRYILIVLDIGLVVVIGLHGWILALRCFDRRFGS
jgi:hypothetical protein